MTDDEDEVEMSTHMETQDENGDNYMMIRQAFSELSFEETNSFISQYNLQLPNHLL
jgi:hypothetical protein